MLPHVRQSWETMTSVSAGHFWQIKHEPICWSKFLIFTSYLNAKVVVGVVVLVVVVVVVVVVRTIVALLLKCRIKMPFLFGHKCIDGL